MDTAGAPGPDPTATGWGVVAHLPARVVACDQAQRWAEAGLPDELADLDLPLGAVWAGVQLALRGADRQALVTALGLNPETAEQIIVVTTEQLLAAEPTLPAGSLPVDGR
ncbi:MAG TPA: hypothetical protein VHH34_08860 [Pseudonocardiaceae bacterium]|nr:hypothetical protein [Pseudonocardiaceae bacterium]